MPEGQRGTKPHGTGVGIDLGERITWRTKEREYKDPPLHNVMVLTDSGGVFSTFLSKYYNVSYSIHDNDIVIYILKLLDPSTFEHVT